HVIGLAGRAADHLGDRVHAPYELDFGFTIDIYHVRNPQRRVHKNGNECYHIMCNCDYARDVRLAVNHMHIGISSVWQTTEKNRSVAYMFCPLNWWNASSRIKLEWAF